MTSTNTWPLCPLVVFCFLWSLALCFQPLFPLTGNSSTHLDITHRALLHKSAEVCRALASAEGRDFSLTIDDTLTVSKVQRACSSSGSTLLSTVMFHTAIAKIFLGNAAVDAVLALSERLHFDDETFQEGRDVITAGVSAVKASVKLENFVAGRLTLGRVCHTLQDFYSHSNWVELGNKSPYGALIKPDQQLDNLAGPSVPTCRNCTDEDCTNNLLPDLMQQGLLTSGYFSLFSSAKPAGKCSHGGAFDLTSLRDPVGGINKDDTGASHGALHHQAANLAVNATVELLEDIRLAVGDKNFLRLMGLSRSSVLCFVIDTTGSMSDDIAEAKRVSFSIIDSKRGTQEEPSAYILVPFNDPGFGPLLITTDADVFKASINRLSASGGGDIPELCLSGLQLALTAAPSSSEIFVFTDAPAKDAHLKGAITALIESSKSVVTFMLTDVLASRRRRRQSQRRTPRSMSQADAQLYRDLAQASGGQAIEVTKSDLTLATSVIEDSSAPAMVTLLQAVRKPGKPDTFSFMVDGSMRNLTAYITGAPSLTFNLTSSSGVSQGSSQISGPLGTFSTVGNLRRFSLSTDNQTGLWEISINSNDPYSLKITGQSSVNFIFNVIELQDGGHRGYSLKESRPLKGGNVSLLVTVTGSDTAKITEVTLVERSGSLQVNGSVQEMGGGNYLVTFSNVPEGEFALSLRGEESATPRSRAGSSAFQRQSPTQLKTSSISISAQANTTAVEPGSTISVPFTVSSAAADGTVNASATGTYAVSVSNDQGYTSSAPATVTLGDGGTANGTVELTVPGTAASGSAVTLTLEAAKDSDVNYAVLRMSVEAKVTDFSGPVCQVISISDTCPSSAAVCSSAQWQFSAQLSDGANGTGISSISVGEGNGTLNTSNQVGAAGENVTMVTFSASCCAQTVELVAVDEVGNVGKCEGRAILKEATTLSPAVTTAAVPTASTGWRPLTLPWLMWIGVAVSLLWR